ncbi:hypothetical protein [Streptomyces hundungensis]
MDFEDAMSDSSVVHTPLVGRIAAGVPVTADVQVEDVLARIIACSACARC